MAIRTVGGCLVALFIVGALLTTGCTLLLSFGDDQAHADAYPRSPLGIEPPIRYQGTAVNGSGIAVTMLVLNLTVTPEAIVSGTPEQDGEIDITKMHITYTDGSDLCILEPGEYSISPRENGDDINTLEPGEVMELTLPLQQPIPANTAVHAEFWTPDHGTLTLSFRIPEVIDLSGQVSEFTAVPFVPY